ncbi:MAG: hypothetical protein KKF48_04065 [Nanoarchaeota archaeon]|nr:hypothetical protein [Nanoarchaeota archaeon]MBU1028194.1 hypothetical protein [Nanoarchaeota archaeon]
MKTKKAEVSITILVIGVFVVCTLALLSFFSSINKVRNSFIGVDLIEKANFEIEKNSLVNYFDEIKDKSFWPWSKEKILFSINYEVIS